MTEKPDETLVLTDDFFTFLVHICVEGFMKNFRTGL